MSSVTTRRITMRFAPLRSQHAVSSFLPTPLSMFLFFSFFLLLLPPPSPSFFHFLSFLFPSSRHLSSKRTIFFNKFAFFRTAHRSGCVSRCLFRTIFPCSEPTWKRCSHTFILRLFCSHHFWPIYFCRECPGTQRSKPETFEFLATFGVARLTLQTRKLWLVGPCRDRPSSALLLTCPNVNNLSKKQKMKMKRNATKNTGKNERTKLEKSKKIKECQIQLGIPAMQRHISIWCDCSYVVR